MGRVWCCWPDRSRSLPKTAAWAGFPSREYAINQALAAWLRLLALDSDMAAAEPKALRFRMLHVPARLARSGRRRNLPGRSPWADQIVEAFRQIMIIPAPT